MIMVMSAPEIFHRILTMACKLVQSQTMNCIFYSCHSFSLTPVVYIFQCIIMMIGKSDRMMSVLFAGVTRVFAFCALWYIFGNWVLKHLHITHLVSVFPVIFISLINSFNVKEPNKFFTNKHSRSATYNNQLFHVLTKVTRYTIHIRSSFQ